jgi:dTDP-4-dehydrorhamnose reductase
MKILVTGAKGMLGRDLVEIMSGCFDVSGIDIEDGDITRLDEIREVIGGQGPDLIAHCAAYTDVDGCESEKDLSYRVNAIGTRNVAACASELDVPLLYISTDFVFSGEKRSPYREYDRPEPINEYGYTKLVGEHFVRHLLKRHYIIRTSWLFGRHGKNFVDTILNRAVEEGMLRVVVDQVGSPTYSRDLCHKLTELIQGRAAFGTYHITNSGACSWCDFARKILVEARLHDIIIEPIPSVELGRAAIRPSNSVLENRALRMEDLEPLRPWEEALSEYLIDSNIEAKQRKP